jgi:hypothetical protein
MRQAEEAGQRLERDKSKAPEVERTSRSLAEIRKENHFAERIRTAIVGGG